MDLGTYPKAPASWLCRTGVWLLDQLLASAEDSRTHAEVGRQPAGLGPQFDFL